MRRIKRKDSAQRGRPAVPDHWTGRPGGSGAQPPLHLIHMVKVGPRARRTLKALMSNACVYMVVIFLIFLGGAGILGEPQNNDSARLC
jgi:hypothetical protein